VLIQSAYLKRKTPQAKLCLFNSNKTGASSEVKNKKTTETIPIHFKIHFFSKV
jgi:hypothetical protein